MVGYCVIVSAGTLLTALGMPGVTLTGPALFYLISSVLTTGAFFMLAELIERTRSFGANVLAVTLDAFDLDDPASVNRSDDVVGVAIPAAMAFLGLAFISCALLVTGLPPLSGFVAKLSLLSAAVSAATESAPPLDAWLLVAAVLLSGLAGLIGLGRAGIRVFWASDDRSTPRLRVIEAGPVAVLILLCVGLAAGAGPVSAYLDDAARSLDHPKSYIDAVMSADGARGARRPVMRRVYFLFLPLFLFVLWLVLNESLSAGQIALGAALALWFTWAASRLRPLKARRGGCGRRCRVPERDGRHHQVQHRGGQADPESAPQRFFAGVHHDPAEHAGSAWPAMLACIVTYTPGTVWVDLTDDHCLKLHVLDLQNEEEWVQLVQDRYERPLKEIFE